MKRIKNYFLYPLICFLFLTVLSGCQEIKIDISMDKDTLLQIGNASCSMQEAIFRLLEERYLYEQTDSERLWKRDINGQTMAEYIKGSVKNEMIRNTACILMSDKMAVYLSEEEEAETRSDAENAYNKIKDIYDIEKYGITLEDVEKLYYKKAVYNMLYEYPAEDLSLQISESDTKVIKVNYLHFPDETYYDKADAIRREVNDGEDFEFSCNQAGFVPEMNKVIIRGDMPESFERVAYALTDGEMSEVVEAGKDDGLYIIQCVEDYMVTESIANNNKTMSEAKKDIFDKQYKEFTTGKKLQFNNLEWDKIDIESL